MVGLVNNEIWLVVVSTPLKNDGVRQWEGWHPIYEMENKKSCLKPPTSISYHPLITSDIKPMIDHHKTII